MVVGVPGQTVDRGRPDVITAESSMPDPLGVSLYSLLTRVIRAPEAGVWHGEDFSI